MKRLTILAALALLTATVGCSSARQMYSGCGCFGNRGAQCDACSVPPAQCCPQPCCDSCGGNGYYAGAGYGGYSEMAPSLAGGSCGCNGGGMMPQDGMIYGGGGVQVVPSPSTSPMIMPTQPMPGPETSLQP